MFNNGDVIQDRSWKWGKKEKSMLQYFNFDHMV